MERKNRIFNCILRLWIIVSLGCSERIRPEQVIDTQLVIKTNTIISKTRMPDEKKIKDVHLFILNEYGVVESVKHLSINDFKNTVFGLTYSLSLIKNKKYEIYVCTNLEYDPQASSLEELKEISCYFAYPDDYSEGIPMSGKTGIFEAGSAEKIEIKLERLLAKVSLKFDRSQLSDDVVMTVKGVQVGNCPKTAKVFTENIVKNSDELFASGFYLNEMECWALNNSLGNYTSDAVDLYILENMQGEINNPDGTADGKIFKDDDPRALCTSYVELELDYKSQKYQTNYGRLKYRFYLGENHRDINVERNCHYKITICPTDDGLNGNSWRIDKTGLEELNQPVFFNVYPGNYIKSYVGEDVYVWCEYSPSYAPFDIGLEELEYDKARGIYDYTIDENGKGVTLHLKKPGSGILYFSFGHPINDQAMVYIEVIP